MGDEPNLESPGVQASGHWPRANFFWVDDIPLERGHIPTKLTGFFVAGK